MPIRSTPWPPGTPCWADVPIPDHAVADPFYRAVLGWEIEAPDERMGGYANAFVDGEHVAGTYAPMGPDQPIAWRLYFATTDSDATAAAIAAHGGTVTAPPMAVLDLGKLTLADDPGGAPFGLWEAGTHVGSKVYGQPGAIAWEDLRSTDPAATQAFYASVFGFEVHPLEMAGPDYGTFHLPGSAAPLGGMGPMMGAPGASHWLVYFAVADVDAAVAAATAHAGSVTTPAFDTPFGRMAGLADPAGAGFLVAAPTGQAPER